jgi:membrane associated rhomboid family serine protease
MPKPPKERQVTNPDLSSWISDSREYDSGGASVVPEFNNAMRRDGGADVVHYAGEDEQAGDWQWGLDGSQQADDVSTMPQYENTMLQHSQPVQQQERQQERAPLVNPSISDEWFGLSGGGSGRSGGSFGGENPMAGQQRRKLSMFSPTAAHIYERRRTVVEASHRAPPIDPALLAVGGDKAAEAAAQRRAAPPPEMVTSRPWFVTLTVAANCLALAYCFKLDKWKIQPMSTNPMIGPSGVTLTHMGAKVTPMILKGQVWRLFSAMFLHGGVIHLGSNMFSLWREGSRLEEEYGWLAVALIYMVGGLAGNITSCIFLPTQITVGASGAVFALFGAIWAEFLVNIRDYSGLDCCAAFFSLLLSTAFNLAIGLMPLVDNFAHTGGFVAGIFCGLAMLVRPIRLTDGSIIAPSFGQKLMGSFAICCIALGTVGLLLCMYLEVDLNDACKWCRCVQRTGCISTSLTHRDHCQLHPCHRQLHQLPRDAVVEVPVRVSQHVPLWEDVS